MEDNEIEYIEPDEGFSWGKGEQFSHPQNVMLAERKCIDAGCKEMKEGHTTEKKDKFGNKLVIWDEDTRSTFIECVESFKMVMAADFDNELVDELNKIEEDRKEIFNQYCKLEQGEWNVAPPPLSYAWKKEGRLYIPGKLSQKFPYYNEYLLDKVRVYRRIFSALDKLAKRLGYYKEGIREA